MRCVMLVSALLSSVALGHPSYSKDNLSLLQKQIALDDGFDMTGFSEEVRPQDDFYEYINGPWLSKREIPPEASRYGLALNVVYVVENNIKNIIEDYAQTPSSSGSIEQKIGDFYASYMDEKTIESRGISPIEDDLKEISKIKNHNDLVNYWAKNFRYYSPDTNYVSGPVPFVPYFTEDLKNSNIRAVYLLQSGISLPNRDYYLSDNDQFKKVREAYPQYISNILSLAHISGANEKALAIYDLEKKISEIQWKQEDFSNFSKFYHKYKVSELKEVSPHIDWRPFLDNLGLSAQDDIIIAQPSFYTGLGNLLASIPLETWKAYTIYKRINNAAPYLSSEFQTAYFQFYNTIVIGQKVQKERQKLAINLVNTAMSDAIGKAYVDRYFSIETKNRVDVIVKNVFAAYRQSIQSVDWMTPATKERALKKLEKIKTKIGYPDKWADYSPLKINRTDLFGNVKRANAYEYQRNLDRLRKPIDKREWSIPTQTVEAYYDQSKNEIVLCAAKLQHPFFQPNADDAVNYAGIGWTIGHEISHAFDNSGSKFNEDGNLEDWWDEIDYKTFESKTARLIEQYNAYSPLPGLHINGTQTLGENISDISGLAIAYKAYLLSLGGKAAPIINSLTGDQRFLISYTLKLREKSRPERLARQITTGFHSPIKYRAIGVLRNLDLFHKVYNTKPGDAMYLAPDERVSIW